MKNTGMIILITLVVLAGCNQRSKNQRALQPAPGVTELTNAYTLTTQQHCSSNKLSTQFDLDWNIYRYNANNGEYDSVV